MEPIPGTASIVQAGLDEAVQSLFDVADAPLASAEELRRAVTSPAVKAVLEMRIEQMVKHGHTAENDDSLPIGWLPKEARDYAGIALNCIGPTASERNLPRALKSLARTAALCLAAYDRIDRAMKNGEAK